MQTKSCMQYNRSYEKSENWAASKICKNYNTSNNLSMVQTTTYKAQIFSTLNQLQR